MLKLLFMAGALALPQVLRAQGGFAPGSYVLNDSRTVRQPGQLKLRGNTQLVVKNAAGQTLRFKPEQVYCCRLGSRKYVTASYFHVKGGLGGTDVDLAFVEQLDSGQVILLRYEYGVGSPVMMGAGGTMVDGSSELTAYLLCRRLNAELTVAQPGGYSSNSKDFREAVRPFLATRPDLVKYLDEKRINKENLPAAIHALNTGAPFSPPSALNME